MKTQEIELQDAYLQLEMAKIDVRYHKATVELIKLMQREHSNEEYNKLSNKRQSIHNEWVEMANKLSYMKNNPLPL
mgnify:CR=1 FL=1